MESDANVDEMEIAEHKQALERHDIFAENVDIPQAIKRAEKRREGDS